jgi:hypothetical protein
MTENSPKIPCIGDVLVVVGMVFLGLQIDQTPNEILLPFLKAKYSWQV